VSREPVDGVPGRLGPLVLRDEPGEALTVPELYALLQLRAAVFVVEQAAAYQDLDGRDLEPGARHLWLDGGAPGEPRPASALRLLPEPGAVRIGRVVTTPEQRNLGLAGRLLRHALATTSGPVVLSAQAHLEAWYGRLGFERAGAGYLEDGIPHVPMCLDRPVSP